MLKSNKPPTSPGHRQPLGQTRIINTHEMDYNASRHTRTPQKKQKAPSQALTETVNRSMPRSVEFLKSCCNVFVQAACPLSTQQWNEL